jgi:hypothetical protein
MSEPENFIARWSRRKRAAVQEVEATKPEAAPDAAAERAPDTERDARDAAVAPSGELPELPFDPASLPPLESITAESDIRAFLAPGVPAELTRAALRRAWAADPKIRDFVGLAENAWDFNTPGSMTGFGPLEMTEELRREVARMVGRALPDEDTDRPVPTSTEAKEERPPVETSLKSAAATPEVPTQAGQSHHGPLVEGDVESSERHNSDPASQRNKVAIAAQNVPGNEHNDQVIAKRPHGSALPK